MAGFQEDTAFAEKVKNIASELFEFFENIQPVFLADEISALFASKGINVANVPEFGDLVKIPANYGQAFPLDLKKKYPHIAHHDKPQMLFFISRKLARSFFKDASVPHILHNFSITVVARKIRQKTLK